MASLRTSATHKWKDKVTGRHYEVGADPDPYSKRTDGGEWGEPEDGMAVAREVLRLAAAGLSLAVVADWIEPTAYYAHGLGAWYVIDRADYNCPNPTAAKDLPGLCRAVRAIYAKHHGEDRVAMVVELDVEDVERYLAGTATPPHQR